VGGFADVLFVYAFDIKEGQMDQLALTTFVARSKRIWKLLLNVVANHGKVLLFLLSPPLQEVKELRKHNIPTLRNTPALFVYCTHLPNNLIKNSIKLLKSADLFFL
jgi:hypothetical protein